MRFVNTWSGRWPVRYLIATLAVALPIAVLERLRPELSQTSIALVLALPVILVAVTQGRGPAALCYRHQNYRKDQDQGNAGLAQFGTQPFQHGDGQRHGQCRNQITDGPAPAPGVHEPHCRTFSPAKALRPVRGLGSGTVCESGSSLRDDVGLKARDCTPSRAKAARSGDPAIPSPPRESRAWRGPHASESLEADTGSGTVFQTAPLPRFGGFLKRAKPAKIALWQSW